MGRKLLIGAAIVLGISAVSASLGYVYWLEERVSPPSEAAYAALVSDDQVTVADDRWLVMEPSDGPARTGLIFYPGGECDHRGYAPPLRQIAERGFLVVVVPMPFYLAVLAPDRAEDVIAAFPDIENWVHRRTFTRRRHGGPLCLHPSQNHARFADLGFIHCRYG